MKYEFWKQVGNYLEKRIPLQHLIVWILRNYDKLAEYEHDIALKIDNYEIEIAEGIADEEELRAYLRRMDPKS